MTENRFFEEMRATAIAYNEAQAIRKEQRDAMIEADDWDGVKAFDEREKKSSLTLSPPARTRRWYSTTDP